ncbi:MAG: Integral membrane protein TerC family protein [Methanomassiliicoccales archaeon PtaU1.Bin030]|nr:MAG: Integral membrane protein TerC family protein [Methanomassiliicoccales archaeon PtaU1.Bin030]
MDVQFWLWGGFFALIAAMLFIDLGLVHRKSHVVRMREALIMSSFWIALAAVFNIGIWLWMGSDLALEFTAAYIMEKTLSVDNLFVFILVFTYFCIPTMYHHKILFWGIIGALVFRGIFIYLGVTVLENFHFFIYIFGGILIYTALKMVLQKDREICPDDNSMVRLFRRVVPITKELHGERFLIKKEGVLMATPLLLTLVFVEASDIMFALDSIPAVLAISKDPFIIYTSNAFALLGLRSLYFVLSSALPLFRYLKYGLAAILGFVGVKMAASDFLHLPVTASLGVIISILALTIIASVLRNRMDGINSSGAGEKLVRGMDQE